MMKRLKLSAEEFRTLREMGIHHPHPRTRMRAQAVCRLSHGVTLQNVADEFDVHLNSVENWLHRWESVGLMGLYEGRHSGRPPTLSPPERRELRQLADEIGGTSRAVAQRWNEGRRRSRLSPTGIRRYLKRMDFRYKRCRLSLKDKRDEAAFERGAGVIASLQSMAEKGECELFYFDETGFSPNPPIQYGWTRIGRTRCAEAGSHGRRVNVLGALGRNNALHWVAQEKRTVRDDVIAFFDSIADLPHPVPCVVALDNAAIHKGEVMREKCREWEKKGLHLYYLPPYSPELNRIEIVWKQAKYFWRKFAYFAKNTLFDEIRSMMNNYGKEFTVNFA